MFISGVTRGGRTAPSDNIQGEGDTRIKLLFLWLSLERTLDKRRGKMGVVRRQLKKVITFQRAMRSSVFFQEKIGLHHQLPPRVTPSIVTPLVFTIFTALHGMPTRSSDGNFVRPSVRQSVRLSIACTVTKQKKDMYRFFRAAWNATRS